MKSWIISVSEIYGSKTQNSSGEICGLKTRSARRWGLYFPDSCSGCRNSQPCRRRDAVGESPTQGGKSRRALAAHSTNCSDIRKRAQKWKKSTEIDRKLWCKTIKCLKDYRDKPNRVCYNTNKQTDTIWFSAGLYVIIRISIFIPTLRQRKTSPRLVWIIKNSSLAENCRKIQKSTESLLSVH